MNYDRARKRMVEEQLIPRGIRDKRILDAIGKVPRHIFVEEALWDRAYGDHALPIGERQSISQPYMVAVMTEALELTGMERILEIGTGSGYQTAILAELAAKVYSIERIKVLAHRARMILDGLNYLNIVIKVFDGTYGWSDEAPFDAIIVTAGAPAIPQAYIEQLKEGGRIIIPVGDRSSQVLKKGVKMGGEIISADLTGCIFVPLIGAFAWKKEENSDRRNNN
ncbi:MAG: protein-L-isoaspartate(D-aspartate) O-methyltransferase [Nitrospirota bacterium]